MTRSLPQPPGGATEWRALVAVGDPDAAAEATYVLVRLGLRVVTLRAGAELTHALSLHVPHLIVTDGLAPATPVERLVQILRSTPAVRDAGVLGIRARPDDARVVRTSEPAATPCHRGDWHDPAGHVTTPGESWGEEAAFGPRHVVDAVLPGSPAVTSGTIVRLMHAVAARWGAGTVAADPELMMSDDADGVVRVRGTALTLTPVEYALLRALASAPDGQGDDDELLATAWGAAPRRSLRGLASAAWRLRRRLAPLGIAIDRITIRRYVLRSVRDARLVPDPPGLELSGLRVPLTRADHTFLSTRVASFAQFARFPPGAVTRMRTPRRDVDAVRRLRAKLAPYGAAIALVSVRGYRLRW